VIGPHLVGDGRQDDLRQSGPRIVELSRIHLHLLLEGTAVPEGFHPQLVQSPRLFFGHHALILTLLQSKGADHALSELAFVGLLSNLLVLVFAPPAGEHAFRFLVHNLLLCLLVEHLHVLEGRSLQRFGSLLLRNHLLQLIPQ